MFVKDKNGSRIRLSTNHKSRWISVSDSKRMAQIKNRLDRSDNLYINDMMYGTSGLDGVVLEIGNKKYPQKKTPYDLRGRNIEVDLDSRGEAVINEVKILRKDSFFLPSYAPLDQALKDFINNKEYYQKVDPPLHYKYAMFFYGSPGNGKTSYIRYLHNQKILPENTTYVWCKALPTSALMKELKRLDNIKVFIFEEITTSLQKGRIDLGEFLQFNDGEQTMENAIYISTTNHPEKLPENITDRPSRFNQMVEFGHPDYESRRIILKTYFRDKFEEDMVTKTEGLSVDQIGEVYRMNLINRFTFDTAVSKVREHKELVKRSFEKYKKIGF